MAVIYNKEGKFVDIGDDNREMEKAISNVEFHYLLKRVTSRQREILLLRREGFTYKEIAEKIGCSERTVRREMSAIRKLNSIIK